MHCVTYPTPQVCGIQVHPPETNVEANTRMPEYASNSINIGIVLLRLDAMGLGDARRDIGSPTSSISKGTTSTTEDSDNWTRNASVSRDADTWPVM